MVYRTAKGLDVPIAGAADAALESRSVTRVGVIGHDYVGLKPTMLVAVGDEVARGQLLFEDKRRPGVRYTAPVAGTVTAINRGEQRAFESLVIARTSDDMAGRGRQLSFGAFTGRHPSALGDDEVRALLLESGLWTAIRARPFSHVADPATRPRSVFVTAIDTEPLAPPAEADLADRAREFETGLAAVARLTTGPVFVCTSEAFSGTVPDVDRVRHVRFSGPHPAGTVGYHMHVLDPVGRGRVAWHLSAADVVSIGHLFATGELRTDRVVALTGPAVARPRLFLAPVGASTDELTAGETVGGDASAARHAPVLAGHAAAESRAGAVSLRAISGSVLSGRAAAGPVHGFVGRYHRQVCVLPEGGVRELLGWAAPGAGKFSALAAFASSVLPARRFPLTTSTNGSPRAVVPIGLYEKVMPFDMEPTYLLKALLTEDLERAEALGCLELDEEDLSLCTFVCPGKHDFAPYLRRVLNAIEKEV